MVASRRKHLQVNNIMMMEFHSALIAMIFVTVFHPTQSLDVKGPPRINHEEASSMVIAKLGDRIRLICPVTSASHLLVQWTKDGETVDESWPSFRIGPRTLRVKSATEDLSGIYECKGITGYGTAQHQIKLIVIDPANERSYKEGDIRGSGGNQYGQDTQYSPLAPPKIIQITPTSPNVLKIASGRVRLKCVASGVPVPTIKWYKNGLELVGYNGDKIDLSLPGQLTMTRLTLTDSGSYECRATSQLGWDKAAFELQVKEAYDRKPEILGETPRNSTVYVGDSLTMECRVKGQSPVHVKWMKRLEPHSSEYDNNASVSIKMLKGNRYLVLNVSEPVALSKDQFLSRLTLTRVQVTDNGQYVCLAANNGGFIVRTSQLTVHSNRHELQFTSSSSLPDEVYAMIVIPVIVVVILSLTAIFCLCQRKSARQAAEEYKCANDPAMMNTRNTFLSLPNEKERANVLLVSEPSSGGPGTCSSRGYHDRRYDPLPPHPTPTPSEHTYNMLMPVGTASSSRSSDRDTDDPGWPYMGRVRAPNSWNPHGNVNYEYRTHRHVHYAC